MKVALVHDWLTGMRGGEKVLESLCEIFPDADIYTLVHIKGSVSPVIEGHKIFTSFIQKLPAVKKKYRYYLSLMPKAIEQFNLNNYDLVVSSSHCVAKGVKVKRDSLHICYCHTPMRYIWDMYDQYFGKKKSNILVRIVMSVFVSYLRKWDILTVSRVDYFIANSKNVGKRIEHHYHRESAVIYPPVDVAKFNNDRIAEDFYLIVSAFAPYKRIDLAIEAFNVLGYSLKIIGVGQEEKRLKKIAKSNIEFLGWKSDEELEDYYCRSKALIFPGEEDFGIVPVEAMAAGRPVIAYAKGGVLETVINEKTGIFFHPQTALGLIEGIRKFIEIEKGFDSKSICRCAQKFGRERFKKEIKEFIDEKTKEKKFA